MLLVIVFATVCLLLGIIFMLGKDTLKKLDNLLNKPLASKDKELGYRYNKILGAVLVILAFILFYISLTIKK